MLCVNSLNNYPILIPDFMHMTIKSAIVSGENTVRTGQILLIFTLYQACYKLLCCLIVFRYSKGVQP